MLQPLARELNYSETVFVYPAGADGHARIRIFTPAIEIPFAGPSDARDGVRPRRPAAARRDPAGDGRGRRPGPARAGGRADRLRADGQPLPSVEPFGDEEALLAALGVERSELPVELYDNGLRNVYICLRVARRRRRAGAGHVSGSPSAACPRRQQLRRLGHGVEDAHVRARRRRARGSGDGLGGRAARASTSSATAASSRARRSRSRRASRSSGRRGCTHGSTGTPEAIERVEVGGSAVIVARGEFWL